jgi:plastocyanin
LLLLAVPAAVLAIGVNLAWGAAPITSSSVCCTFTAPTFSIDQGEVASFQNGTIGGAPHNVTASKSGPDGRPQFFSNTISSGSTPVNGTQYLTSGTYQFVCTIHPGMDAALVVSGNGTPVARPKVSLKVVSSKLKKVANSGKLKVKVTAATASNGVVLSAKKGSKTLTRASKLSLAAGASKTVSLGLTTNGRKLLKGSKKAAVKVTGTVDFGSSASAKRTLK